MIWARWAGVMGVPMKWEIARIFVVGTGGSVCCAESAPSGVIGSFMAVAPYSSVGSVVLMVSLCEADRRRWPDSPGVPGTIARRRLCRDPVGWGLVLSGR